MSTVALVKNRKTGLMANKTASGNWYRVQVQGTTNSWNNGFQRTSNRTGFAYFQSKEGADAFVNSGTKSIVNGEEVITVTGKVVYKDQLTPIGKGEMASFGIQIPYLMNLNGKTLELDQRIAIQKEAATKSLTWMQSGNPIYRQKFFSPNTEEADLILSPDNTDEVLAFAATVVASMGTGDDKAAKEARLAELRGIAKSARTADQKKELLELTEELEG